MAVLLAQKLASGHRALNLTMIPDFIEENIYFNCLLVTFSLIQALDLIVFAVFRRYFHKPLSLITDVHRRQLALLQPHLAAELRWGPGPGAGRAPPLRGPRNTGGGGRPVQGQGGHSVVSEAALDALVKVLRARDRSCKRVRRSSGIQSVDLGRFIGYI